jgi:enterobactin synthetase component F
LIIDTLIREKATLTNVSPHLLRVLIPELAARQDELELREVNTSGSALLRGDLQRFFAAGLGGIALSQMYGSTETGPMYRQSYTEADDQAGRSLPLGQPAPHCQIDILDEVGRLAGSNEVGSFFVRSPYLARGYLHASQEDSDRFFAEPVTEIPSFNIGELGFRNDSGEIYIAGRSDRQINVYGRRFDCAEIEAAMLRHPDVLEAVIPTMEDINDGRQLMAVVSSLPNRSIAAHQLREFLRDLLPAAAIPRRIFPVADLPMTRSGKLDRPAIDALVDGLVAADVQEQSDAPRGIVENWIADCWQEVLAIPRPGRMDHFENLGGDSHAAIELSALVESCTGSSLDLDTILRNPTIAGQAQSLNAPKQGPRSLLVTLKESKIGPRIVLIPGLGGHAWNFSQLAGEVQADCLIQAVSIVSFYQTGNPSPTREGIAKQLAQTILAEDPTRDTYVGGFSLGGALACDLATELVRCGLVPQRVVLLDPTTAKKPQKRRWYSQPFRLRSKAKRRVEAKLVDVQHHQKETYQGRIRLPDVALSLLETADSDLELHCDPDLATVNIPERSMSQYQHLDLLRYPSLIETAHWIDTVIESATNLGSQPGRAVPAFIGSETGT